MISYALKLLLYSLLLCNVYVPLVSRNISSSSPASSDVNESYKEFDFNEVSFGEFDGVSFGEEDDSIFMNDYFDTIGVERVSRMIDPSDIMAIINAFGLPAIVQEPIFLHTNILNKRSLLDQPIFEPDRPEFPGSWVVGASFFARKTNRSNFTKDSDKLSSYLALTEATLIGKLQDTIDKVNQFNGTAPIDIAKILNLFENMTVEERQIGFMTHCMKRWRDTTFRIMFPTYYLESNFSLTKEEQDAVVEALGRMEPEEEKRFRKAHLISDKIGIGDTRIEIDQRVLKRPSFTWRCGGFATIPTAWTWGGGFEGSSFAKPSTLPTFELETIFDIIKNPGPNAEQTAINLLADFFLDSFDRMAADLITIPLGNRRHLGVGLFMRSKTPLRAWMNNSFAERTKLTNRISLEGFFPATEKRFYINKINEQAFADHDFENLDPVVAAENLEFLTEQMVSRLFLRAFDTVIVPGVIFRWSSMAQYKGERFGFNLGTDFWLQGKDLFSSIRVPSQKTLHEIDIPKAKPPVANQSKVFGGILYKHKTDINTWFFSLNVDATLNNKGLGQDYSVAFNFEASF